MKNLKKYSFWTGLAGASVIVCDAIAKCFGIKIENQIVENIIMSICGVLVALGIVTIPKSNNKQSEKTEQDDTKNAE